MVSIEDCDKRLAFDLSQVKEIVAKLETDPTDVDQWGLLRGYAADGDGYSWERQHQMEKQ